MEEVDGKRDVRGRFLLLEDEEVDGSALMLRLLPTIESMADALLLFFFVLMLSEGVDFRLHSIGAMVSKSMILVL
jgi:hypothetical protein